MSFLLIIMSKYEILKASTLIIFSPSFVSIFLIDVFGAAILYSSGRVSVIL